MRADDFAGNRHQQRNKGLHRRAKYDQWKSVAKTDELNLDVVRKHLAELLAKDAHDELLAVVLALLENLGRRTTSLEFELMRLRKAAKGRKSEKLDLIRRRVRGRKREQRRTSLRT